jgi:hypothetical protein
MQQDLLTFDEIRGAFTLEEPFAPQNRFTDVSNEADNEETEHVVGSASDKSAAKPTKW